MALSNQTLSNFFSDFDTFYQIKKALQQSFDDIRALQAEADAARRALEAKRAQQVELRNLQKLQAQQIQDQEREKQQLLALAKQEEQTRRNVLEQKQKTAAQIRAELFALRDSTAIPFGEAVRLAQQAERATGVRAALILGTLKQETKLGEFIGTGNWRIDMHPTRDRSLFLVITQTLGYDPDKMPVSAQPGYGWGGAMGPAQFIPSTWACYGGYINVLTGDCNNQARKLSWNDFWAGPWRYDPSRDRIRALLGVNRPSDPWQNADAFMAAALLLKENGADARTYSEERLAALRYFAGLANAKNPAYAFYGDSVMRYASEFQQLIDILERER
jgi:membrane-bound lytic murein transglycosylase B